MELKPLKISELNHYINRILSSDALLYSLNVEGEISNCKYHSSGHIYFSLKDEKSKIRCVIFSGNAENLGIELSDGMRVVAMGSINVFERDGSYQLNIRKIRDEGRGALYEKFEALKEKLYLEGLFDEDRKKPIPKYPKKIGIITSITGSTLRDMVINIKRRNPSVELLIKPAIVQGRESKDSLIDAIETLSEREDLDTIIIGRGGGSIEELWSFNEEEVARAVYRCNIPIISAVGHETDYTIADFAADLRASTPSVAAELSVFPLDETLINIFKLKERLFKAEKRLVELQSSTLSHTRERLLRYSPSESLKYSKAEIDTYMNKMETLISSMIFKHKSELENLAGKLHSLSPISTLDRGFTFIENSSGNIVNSKKDLDIGERVKVRFKDGTAFAEIVDKE